MGGDAKFCQLSRVLAFGGDCPATAQGRIATVQTLSGTGALRVSSYQDQLVLLLSGQLSRVVLPLVFDVVLVQSPPRLGCVGAGIKLHQL